MDKIAIYGKGGSGKSMVSANLSVQYALDSKRVLQIGCDPKHDSTLSLTGGEHIPTVLSLIEESKSRDIPNEQFVRTGSHGIQCIEAGGPEPGVGCAGRGIVMVFQLVKRDNYLGNFDVVLLDVLGDVVCGGFAAPLMHGMASKVAILVADNLMAMYAANNIAKAINRFQRNGVYLAGLIANNVQRMENLKNIEKFAERLQTRILGVIPHDDRILDSELEGRTISEIYPDSDLFRAFQDLSKDLLAIKKSDCPSPAPMTDSERDGFFKSLKK